MKPIVKPSVIAVFDHYGLQVIGRDVGGWRKAECPLPAHEDNNPSASVNEEGERFWCHACNQGGDSLDIIQEREGIAGLAGAIAFSEALFGAVDSQVRDSGGSSSLLPPRQGARKSGGHFVPAWRRL